METLFTIMIPTTPDRKALCDLLVLNLQNQIILHPKRDQIELMVWEDEKQESIGSKRQRMLEAAKGRYVAGIDSDDIVSPNYVNRILGGILHFYENTKQYPDCVGIRGTMTTDGKNLQTWCVRNKYDWTDNVDGFRYVRYTHHWCPVLREHALAAGFPDKRFGEDYDYSMRLKVSGLLQTEVFIDEPIYHYNYNAPRTKKESNEKYGIK